MQVNFSKSPEEFFFTPGKDPGLVFAHEPNWMWRPVSGGKIAAYAASDHKNVNDQISSHINTHINQRNFSQKIEINTVPVHLKNVRFEHSYMAVKGKWVLNGASGTRLRNKYYQKNLEETPDIDHKVIAYFKSLTHVKNTLPVENGIPTDANFVIECRNTFNFYHFLTETLGQLSTAADFGITGRILIHSPSKGAKDFIVRWVDALFPELKKRVRFKTAPKKYAKAISALNLRHFYNQAHEDVMPSLDEHAPNGWMWQSRDADRTSQAILAMNSYDANLRRLRDRAVALAEDAGIKNLPKRFYMARKASGPRDRTMRGEDALIEKLTPLGFEKIFFEDLSPLEQVSIMQNAEVMVSYHGAGFANMIFANPNTHVIEIGNLQSALFRWADFMPHAHVSECHYTCFFADFFSDDPSHVPDMRSKDLQSVAIGQAGIHKLLSFVEAILLDPKEIKDHDHLMRTALILNTGEKWDVLASLLLAHPEWVDRNVDLLVMQANCYRHFKQPRATFDTLSKAWHLTHKRPAILERMVRLAEELSGQEAAKLLLSLHLKHFPGRHVTFQNHFEWYTPHS